MNEVKEKLLKMESLYDKLKIENEELTKQKEQLQKDLSNVENNLADLRIKTNLSKINSNKGVKEQKNKLNNSITNSKNYDYNDENLVNIKIDKLIQKIKDYKKTNDLLIQQINLLKDQIKEDEILIDKNDKDEQIEGLKMIVNKLIKDKEKILNEQLNKSNNELYKLETELNAANNNIKLLSEKIEFLKKNKNMSEDINIVYPQINDIKERYSELEEKYKKVEKKIINLLNNIKCSSDIENIIIELCEALKLSDGLTKKIINNR